MGKALHAIAAVVVVLVLVAGALYASDFGVGATITRKDQDSSGYYVVATTGFGYAQKKLLPFDQWTLVQVGNFVIYHIASGHMQVYDREGGRLIYSS